MTDNALPSSEAVATAPHDVVDHQEEYLSYGDAAGKRQLGGRTG